MASTTQEIVILHSGGKLLVRYQDHQGEIYNRDGKLVLSRRPIDMILRFVHVSDPWEPLPLDQVPSTVLARLAD